MTFSSSQHPCPRLPYLSSAIASLFSSLVIPFAYRLSPLIRFNHFLSSQTLIFSRRAACKAWCWTFGPSPRAMAAWRSRFQLSKSSRRYDGRVGVKDSYLRPLCPRRGVELCRLVGRDGLEPTSGDGVMGRRYLRRSWCFVSRWLDGELMGFSL